MVERIGLTMRVESGGPDGESRDALAHDWPRLMALALGDAPWVPIPNLGQCVEQFLDAWAIDAVVLTGGNDVSACPLRDETERVVLDRCIGGGLPVLGVCRGLQLAQAYFGGALRTASEAHRSGHVHAVELCDDGGRRMLGARRIEVPSFHRCAVRLDELHPELEAWAISEDGLVEGLRCRSAPLVAVQWHPERPLPNPDLGVRLLRGLRDGWR